MRIIVWVLYQIFAKAYYLCSVFSDVHAAKYTKKARE